MTSINFDYPNLTAEVIEDTNIGPAAVRIFKMYDEETEEEFRDRVIETLEQNNEIKAV